MSGPYTVDGNGKKSSVRIWESDLTSDEEARFDDYVYLRSLKIAVRKEKEKRDELNKYKDLGIL